MYHSIQIGNDDYWINTYDDWHLIPSSRPLVKTPSLKTNFVEIPGTSGSIDLSTVLTGYPLYSDREGSWEFYVLNGYQDWYTLCDDICNYLHGRTMQCILEDQPDWYYQGLFKFNEWKSDKDYSKVVIDYRLEPYKLSITEFDEILPLNPDLAWNRTNTIELDVDRMPILPTISLSGNEHTTWKCQFTNPEMGIDVIRSMENGNTITPDDMIMTNISGKNVVTFKYYNTGNVRLRYRNGRL